MKFKTIPACIVKILNSLKVLKQKSKNKSEKIFERYLNSNGFRGKWIYEPSISGKSKKPDYLLNHNGQECFLEVKELRKKPDQLTEVAAWVDPYSSLRSTIHKAKEKFREYKQYSCSLVVFNVSDFHAILKPICVFGAMLGNLGVTGDIERTEGKLFERTKKNAFLDGGKMIDNKGERLQNTTISTIAILEEYIDSIDVRKVPRVIIIENPFARIAFPEDLFVGPFDERWRWTEKNGKVERVFVGSKLKKLEELKGKS
jgi:hypothetical protein